ncbi:Phox-associated sorting nexin [Chloropicon primus]|uniref:Phox-associated sorting nexin n=1 Tax=Chloropicon primus TaxID=1764295 RepID=A0A5B8MD66_9CHLO|nr:Phox-associated sorting nexin [Chloropicon primus]|eukprot:QDZ18518.1 Phox-associated sorting nexin [Chloropicon primus]
MASGEAGGGLVLKVLRRVRGLLTDLGPKIDNEYRYLILSFCVLLAAMTLTWTGDTVFENIPLAMFAVGSAAWLYNKQARLYELLRAQEQGEKSKENALSRVSSAVDSSKESENGWRSLVRAPKVEESWEVFASCIVQEFIYDLWYVFITNDVEFPAVVRVILNGAFGELALRGRALDMPSIISETCEAISEQLELFRTTREEVGPSFKHLSYAKRDYKLKQQLQKNHMLHPAVESEKQKKQVLKVVFDTVSKILLCKQDASRPVLRIIVRELLANSVIEPLLVYFTPMQGNCLLLAGLTMGSGEEKDKEEDKEEDKPDKVGDIKWRAKQSENFENKTKSNPSIVYTSTSGKKDKKKKGAKTKDDGDSRAPAFGTIEESNDEAAGTEKKEAVNRAVPSFSCRPVVKVLSAEEKFDKNISGKKRFIVYTIRVKEGYRQWYIYRRYRNFTTLHKRMRIIPGYAFKLPPKRIFGFTHMSEQYVQNRCDGLNLYIHQLLHSSIWQCQEVADFLSEGSDVYGIESREEENVIRRLGTDISEVSKSVGKKFEATYQGFGNILANEYQKVGKLGATSGKVVKSVLFEWRKKPKKEDSRPSAQELSEHVKLFQELKTMKKQYSMQPSSGETKTIGEKSEDELIKEYLSEVTQELYLRTAVDNMTGPILGVIDTLFQLDTTAFLRRQVVGVTKQLFEVFVGSRVEKFLMSKVKDLCTEETVSSIIDSIVDSLWPNGLWMAPPETDEAGVPIVPEKPLQAWERKPSFSPSFRPSISIHEQLQERRERSFSRLLPTLSETNSPRLKPGGSAPPLKKTFSMTDSRLNDYTRIQRALSAIVPPEQLEIMNDEEVETREKVKEAIKDLVPPKAVSTLIGKRNFLQGINDLFDFIQSETMMAQLGHLILEIILVKEFPELEAVYARIRNGDLRLVDQEPEGAEAEAGTTTTTKAESRQTRGLG